MKNFAIFHSIVRYQYYIFNKFAENYSILIERKKRKLKNFFFDILEIENLKQGKS